MILDILFPNRCLHCNLIIDGKDLLCEGCFYQIPFTHHRFGEENDLSKRCRTHFPIENSFALMNFEQGNLAQKIIHQLKYADKEYFGKHIAQWTFDRLEFLQKPDLLVSVPLHPKKQKKRGYNQLHLFAKTLSEHYGIPLENDLLKRNFYNQAQAKKDRNHRTEVDRLFSVTQKIENQHILLVDDVLTTGNTLSAIAWEFLKNSNNKISVLVMALD
ncbi:MULTISPECIES: ComF family protein [Amniculibacterium]|jgi:ComF family protein|uniref:ComF family protein n=1 Tax=Amniculibacterium TaxID=2715289 RepID=UPI000F5A1D64|nr:MULTISPECIES: phosphoribosyltransferase family protein [Amniculibacterium]